MLIKKNCKFLIQLNNEINLLVVVQFSWHQRFGAPWVSFLDTHPLNFITGGRPAFQTAHAIRFKEKPLSDSWIPHKISLRMNFRVDWIPYMIYLYNLVLPVSSTEWRQKVFLAVFLCLPFGKPWLQSTFSHVYQTPTMSPQFGAYSTDNPLGKTWKTLVLPMSFTDGRHNKVFLAPSHVFR